MTLVSEPTTWMWPLVLAPFVGSFIGVVAMRVENPAAIAFGRSCCTECQTRLGAADLVPFFSWLALRGHCRHCCKPIGAFYPLIELAALGVALWCAATVPDNMLWIDCLFGWALLALAATDFRYFLLPDFLTLPLIAAGLLVTALVAPSMLTPHLFAAASGFLLVVALRTVYRWLRGREGMGLGDAKLLAAAGAWIGVEGLPSVILIAAVSALFFALLTGLFKATLSLTDAVPFGAFLALGAWIVWLYGPLVMG